MSVLYVVRHGEDEDNAAGRLNGHRPTSLTLRGREQVKRTAAHLRGKSVHRLYASPLQRAMETAQIIADEVHLPVEPHPLLIERDFGILTGHPYEDIPRLASKTIQATGIEFFLEAEGVETFDAVYRRAQRLRQELRQNHRNENVILVTHGDTGTMIRAVFQGLPWEEGLRRAKTFANAEVVEINLMQTP